MIRKRYPREDPPTVDKDPQTELLVFYHSDGRTELADPSPDWNSDDVDPVMDVINDDVAGLQSLLASAIPDSGDNVSEDSFDDRIFEVYGPPTRRPRLSNDDRLAMPPESPTCDSQRLKSADSEEQSVPVQENDISPNVPSLSDQVSTANSRVAVCDEANTPDPSAVVPMTGPHDDGLMDDPPADPESADGLCHVTQDEELDSPISDEVAQQFSIVADDSDNDEQFDGIDGHEWNDGALMFRVRWKTDEVSTLPFNLVKRDFPRETATYVLKNKIGSSGGKHTAGGRYTRWARQFQRQYSRVIRRILRDADGVHSLQPDTIGIQVASNLPNGTRLIRRVVRAAPKPCGTRKRKKPGRTSRPIDVKYSVVVPRSVTHALELDAEAGNTFWGDAIRKEIASLLALDCFEFHAPDYKPSSLDYQWAKLSMIFEVKQDGSLLVATWLTQRRSIHVRRWSRGSASDSSI